jgi:hypothetical protein
MLRVAGSKLALRPLGFAVRAMAGTPTYTGTSFKEGERAVEVRTLLRRKGWSGRACVPPSRPRFRLAARRSCGCACAARWVR